MSVTEQVVSNLQTVLKNNGHGSPELHPHTSLDALGLDSLDFAELIVRLEMDLGKDPFSQDDPPTVRTVDDLVKAYE